MGVKKIGLLTNLFSVWALLSGFAFAKAAPAEVIKIGFTPPITGQEADEGSLHIKALKLAVKQINAAGGVRGKPVELVVLDTKSTPQGALEAYEQLVRKEKVTAIVGSTKSAQLVAILPKTAKDGVPVMIGGTATRLTEEGNRWFFRTRPSDAIVATAMVRYLKESTGFKKIAIVNDTSAFGVGGGNLVAKAISDSGLSLIKRESFGLGEEAKFAGALQAVKDAGAEAAVVFVGRNDDHGKLMVIHRNMGKPYLYFGTSSVISNPAMAIAKDAADGAIGAVDFVMASTPSSKKYAEEYRKEYGEEANVQSVYAYDGIKILAKVINEVGGDREKIREAILKLHDYQGVGGTYNFDANGNGLHEVSIVKIENKKPQLIKVVHGDG